MPGRDIRTLIQLHKLRVDEQRRALAQRQREADELIAAMAALEAALEVEKMKAAEQQLAGNELFNFGAYVEKELNRWELFRNALARKEEEVALEREKLALVFEELKRYEIAQESWNAEYAAEQKKLEAQTLDEQASQRHHRKETD